MLQPSVVQAATFLVTLVFCLALVATTKWHGRLLWIPRSACRSFIERPPPRIGGLATLAGLVAGYGVAPEPVRQLLGALAHRIPSGVLFRSAGGSDEGSRSSRATAGHHSQWLRGLVRDRDGPDPNRCAPAWTICCRSRPCRFCFTAVAIGGVANAVNIIDGFNGLAGGVLSIMFTALGVIAAGVGDPALAGTCWALAGCSVAFTLVNWPFGKIFLGDGGAYQLGFALGWVAVLLVVRNPAVPAWAPLMVCAYPVLEVSFSVVRKGRRAGYNPCQPDRVHLHMLVHRRVVRPWLSSRSRPCRTG